MRFSIVYRGQDAGLVEVDTDARGMIFTAQCRVHTLAVLRLYGLTEQGQPLLVGVLEPEGGILRLRRRITPETLRSAGVRRPPERYYLEDGEPGCRPVQLEAEPGLAEEGPTAQSEEPRTGDALLDRLIESGSISLARDGADWIVRIPFSAGRANPLHFALAACKVELENGQPVAVLRYPDKKPVVKKSPASSETGDESLQL